MAVWAFIVFLLGAIALIFNLYEIFTWFTPWWGLVLMVVSFGMLNRIWQKEREAEKEILKERLEDLEAELKVMP